MTYRRFIPTFQRCSRFSEYRLVGIGTQLGIDIGYCDLASC